MLRPRHTGGPFALLLMPASPLISTRHSMLFQYCGLAHFGYTRIRTQTHSKSRRSGWAYWQVQRQGSRMGNLSKTYQVKLSYWYPIRAPHNVIGPHLQQSLFLNVYVTIQQVLKNIPTTFQFAALSFILSLAMRLRSAAACNAH